jgi:hypothetical protein
MEEHLGPGCGGDTSAYYAGYFRKDLDEFGLLGATAAIGDAAVDGNRGGFAAICGGRSPWGSRGCERGADEVGETLSVGRGET